MKPIGHRIIRLEEVHSTNTLLLENEQYMDEHGLVALARHQTQGRGRMGRTWTSLSGRQLQFSVVLHPPLRAEELPAMSLVCGLAVARALEESNGLSPRLKWPNDVLIEGRKVCGILVESRPGTSGEQRLVVGIGINCRGPSADYPEDIRGGLTTLEEALTILGRGPVDEEEVLQAVLAELESLHERLVRGEMSLVLEEWKHRAVLKGQRVALDTPAGRREGQPLDITSEGYLLIELDGGERIRQISGEVLWLEPLH
ncbi:MAG: biotin--[acetyl-CoA-carboxylase] ligase [Deltaproteobacteria bacterium]|nr:biotin--[acetyl-CoA-carboxylase] ligase [Deltaproteobacteria bacterium]